MIKTNIGTKTYIKQIYKEEDNIILIERLLLIDRWSLELSLAQFVVGLDNWIYAQSTKASKFLLA